MRFGSLARTSLVIASLTSLLALGCDFQPSASPGSDSRVTQGSGGQAGGAGGAGGVRLIIGGSGGSSAGGAPGGGGATGSSCPVPCPTGQVCLGGRCQADPCLAAATACGAGMTCRASCVAITDRCAAVSCPKDQTCI